MLKEIEVVSHLINFILWTRKLRSTAFVPTRCDNFSYAHRHLTYKILEIIMKMKSNVQSFHDTDKKFMTSKLEKRKKHGQCIKMKKINAQSWNPGF